MHSKIKLHTFVCVVCALARRAHAIWAFRAFSCAYELECEQVDSIKWNRMTYWHRKLYNGMHEIIFDRQSLAITIPTIFFSPFSFALARDILLPADGSVATLNFLSPADISTTKWTLTRSSSSCTISFEMRRTIVFCGRLANGWEHSAACAIQMGRTYTVHFGV